MDKDPTHNLGNSVSDFVEETRIYSADSKVPLSTGPFGKIKVDPIPDILEPRLKITAGPGKGAFFAIKKPLVILGRVEEVADIVVPNNSASRHHAAIGHQEGRFMIYDLGSTNGTKLNGKWIKESPITHGSIIEIGENVFTFLLDDE